MENLIYDEQEEIDRILRALTNWMRPHEDILANYQRYATEIDVICAKSLYTQQINGVMPKLNDTTDLETNHDILFLQCFHSINKRYRQRGKIELYRDAVQGQGGPRHVRPE